MRLIANKTVIICAASAIMMVTPYSVRVSRQTGVTLGANQAEAVIGRPATPLSAAGVARRTTRRHLYHHHYAHPHCVWVVVHGARVCR
jgi:hypothetical protein